MKLRLLASTAVAFSVLAPSAPAAFHVMQIEQIIGGLNGDNTAQAIQLRLRSGGQSVTSSARLRAWDATGANPVLLLDIAGNVGNGSLGDNVLIASSSFNAIMTTAYGASYATDFTLANLIPSSYLSGGKVTFESDGGFIYWSLAFGNYTGLNTSGDATNDADSNFGAPTIALPTNSLTGVRFTGASSALSTTNVADYALTGNPATVRNNARNSFAVAPEPGSAAVVLVSGIGLVGLAFARRRRV